MSLNNPFFHRGPIRDPHFFWNRDEEVRRARTLLAQGQSTSVVGARRIGKSSYLLHLGSDLDAGDVPLAGDEVHWVYFNCEAWSTAPPETLYALLAQAMADAGVRWPGIALTPAMQLDYRAFRQALLDALLPQGRLVLLLDEFEALAMNPHLGADFFSGLRALATSGEIALLAPLPSVMYPRIMWRAWRGNRRLPQGRNDARNGADTIVLSAQTYFLSITGLDADANAGVGDLDLTDPAGVTFRGAGAARLALFLNDDRTTLLQSGGFPVPTVVG